MERTFSEPFLLQLQQTAEAENAPDQLKEQVMAQPDLGIDISNRNVYILDEIEAALDDSNLRRLMNYLATVRDFAQFIMITHQRRTMEAADILYGVSMQADGVTKVLSQRIDQARAKEE